MFVASRYKLFSRWRPFWLGTSLADAVHSCISLDLQFKHDALNKWDVLLSISRLEPVRVDFCYLIVQNLWDFRGLKCFPCGTLVAQFAPALLYTWHIPRCRGHCDRVWKGRFLGEGSMNWCCLHVPSFIYIFCIIHSLVTLSPILISNLSTRFLSW